jgi:PPOX class probable F420-dependent enzyme
MQLTESQQAFLNEVHYAVVGTLNPDGSIQQTVVWFLREANNELRFSIGDNSVKARNLRRNPTVTVTVQDKKRYLSLSGQATVAPVDPELRYRLAVRYVGAERAEEWVARRPDAPRASVRVTVNRVYGQGV